jgi:hypothetical protein
MLDKIMKGKKVWKRALAGVLSAAMVFSGLGGVSPASVAKAEEATATFKLTADSDTDLAKQTSTKRDLTGYYTNGKLQTTEVSDARFKLVLSNSKGGAEKYTDTKWSFGTDSNKREYEYRINTQIDISGTAIEFTVSKSNTTVECYWAAGDNDARYAKLINTSDSSEITAASIVDASGTAKPDTAVKNTIYKSTFSSIDSGTYRIGSSSKTCYIYEIVITEPAGDVAKVNVTPTISEGANLLPQDLSVAIQKGSESYTVTSGTAVSLAASTKYNLAVVDADGNVNSHYSATVSGESSFTTGEAASDISIVVTALDKSIAVSIDETAASLGAGSVVLTNKSDATDSHTLTDGSSVTLPAGQTYKVSVTGNNRVAASIADSDEIAVTADTSAIAVKISSLERTVPVTIDESEASLGSAVLTLTNSSDETETFTLKNGESVTLIKGQKYIVSCSDADMILTVNNSTDNNFTVGDDTTLTVALSKQVEGLYNFAQLGYIKAGLKISGGDYGCGVSVMEDWNVSPSDSAQEIGGAYFTTCTTGKSNAATGASNSNGTIPDSGAALKIAPTQDGSLKLYVKMNSGKPQYFIDVDESGNITKLMDAYTPSSNEYKLLSYKLQQGHTYYFYAQGSKTSFYNIIVDYRTSAAWSTVKEPVLGTPVVDNTAGTITVPFTAQVGGLYADSIEVDMYKDGVKAGTQSYAVESTEGSVTFTPEASGVYTFKAALKRSGEEDKNSNEVTSAAFVLPLQAPSVATIANKGGGSIEVEFNPVSEATEYILYVDGVETARSSSTVIKIENLNVGQTYAISGRAVRDSEEGPIGEAKSHTVQDKIERAWAFTWYGTSTDEAHNGYEGNINDGSVTVYSTGGKGKIVPNSTDGLAFYYTKIDPETENFTLEADITVDEWTLSNGQDGFGMMVADTIGHNSTDTIWNNSIQNIVSKVEYYYNNETGVTTDTTANKISMKLGVGALVRLGVTADDIANIKSGAISMPVNFTTETTPLETSCGSLGTGTYNIIGNYTTEPTGTQSDKLLTTFHMSITRNNTGYIVKYTDKDGNVIEKKVYDFDRNELTQIDADNIYLGFFASRNAKITVTNMNLTTKAPEDDDPAEERPITTIVPSYTIESATFSSTEQYDLVYYGNADGHLYITNDEGEVVADEDVMAATKVTKSVLLNAGSNIFTVSFTPNADYMPAAYTKLDSYDTVTFTHTVKLTTAKEQTNLYVSPNGISSANGTKSSPLDIYTAVKIVTPGQKIILMEGTYNLVSTVKVERGINGEEDNLIYMIADPEASTRPVLDFGGNCAGMILAGDYWYFQGFDVTKSADAQKGIQVSGSHNTLDNIRTYRNGNTGIQISRYKSTDERDQWPSYNLILNCSSYLNADKGYEDADGFAAKLTVGDGNVFDGCISAYNADDGWDCYAKVETGSIGKVTIQNCVAFKNGYVLDDNGNEINAGNGNGFKMGGESMTGYHTLINSVAFDNKAKGIDSNSCPDIQIYNSISFNNESYNVAFYTNNAVNTDFFADSLVSYKTDNAVAEQIKPVGTQKDDTSKIYGATNFYTYGKENSYNTENTSVDAGWFKSIDTAAAEQAFIQSILSGSQTLTGTIVRNADGTINMNGLLELTSAAPVKAGLYSTAVSGSSSSLVIDTTNLRAVVNYSLESALTNAVKAKTGASNEDELRVYLKDKVKSFVTENGVLTDALVNDSAVYDVKIQISVDGGDTWVDATADNFPANGITVTLPYPDETGKKGYNFAVGHLIVMGLNGKTPGDMEMFTGDDVTKSAFGVRVHIMSASPFVIAYEKSLTNTNDEDDDDDDESVIALSAEEAKKKTAGYPKSAKTFDDGTTPVPVLDILPNFSYDNLSGTDTTGVTQKSSSTTTSEGSTFSPVSASKAIIFALVAVAVAGIAGAGVIVARKRREETEE